MEIRIFECQAIRWEPAVGRKSKGPLYLHGYRLLFLAGLPVRSTAFRINNRLVATPEELKAANQGTLAYFGTYSVDEANKVVTFRTEASTFPNSEGEVLKRIIAKLTTDEMIYTNPSTTLGDRVEANWRRIK
jgi:Lipocalin-like domain